MRRRDSTLLELARLDYAELNAVCRRLPAAIDRATDALRRLACELDWLAIEATLEEDRHARRPLRPL